MSRGGPDPWVILATVIRPQGREGEVIAECETDFPDLFDSRPRLFLRAPAGAENGAPREVQLRGWRRHGTRLVFRLSGVDSIEQAEGLRGWELVLPREERAPLEEGAVYYADLVGCTLFDRTAARTAGVIVGVDRESGNLDLFVVRVPSVDEEQLVPFALAYEPKIDLEGRRVEMTLPAGLLDLGSPGDDSERGPERKDG